MRFASTSSRHVVWKVSREDTKQRKKAIAEASYTYYLVKKKAQRKWICDGNSEVAMVVLKA